MREYKIALPVKSNSGEDYAKQRRQWEHAALMMAGGFTRDGKHSHGEWRDPKDGTIFSEAMQGYTVAAAPRKFGLLWKYALKLFHDQRAVYTSEGGTVHIHFRPKG